MMPMFDLWDRHWPVLLFLNLLDLFVDEFISLIVLLQIRLSKLFLSMMENSRVRFKDWSSLLKRSNDIDILSNFTSFYKTQHPFVKLMSLDSILIWKWI